jgi:hypothetical protein
MGQIARFHRRVQIAEARRAAFLRRQGKYGLMV